jgi:hypothetical protein
MRVYDFHGPTPQGPAAQDQQAFLIGIDFHEAALRCEVSVKDPDGAPVVALCPMIVSYAFAAELYLKALATAGTGRAAIRGHKLHVLYGRLDGDVRDEVARTYEARTGRSAIDLDGDLRAFSDAFVDWRYVFEGAGQQVRVNLLAAFVQSTYATVRTRCPDWSVRLGQDARLQHQPATLSMTVANLGGGTFLHMVDGTTGAQLNTPDA